MTNIERIKNEILSVIFGGRDPEACQWSLVDVLAFSVLIAVFAFKDPFHLGAHIIRYLRLHFFIFTKEPKLLYYLSIYIGSIIFKCVSLVLLAALVKLRGISFRRSVLSPGRVPPSWEVWLPLYIIACVVMRLVSIMNPLVPNIPFNSLFTEALVVGNAVTIFSVLLVAPFVEEVLFRGFLYPGLNRHLGIHPAVFITSLLFTLAHYPQIKEDIVFMAVIFALSLMITYAKARTGSTYLAIKMHFLYNLVSIGIGFVNYAIVRY